MTSAVATQQAFDLAIEDISVLSRASGIPLVAYRPDHVGPQVERALRATGTNSPDELARLLTSSEAIRTRFRRAIAISVTSRFRDPEQFDQLETDLLPILAKRPGSLRIWSAGCADGSELYSLAEVLERNGLLERSTLLGSDLLWENIELARGRQVPDVSVSIRARVRWEQRDLVNEDLPAPAWSLILCRNLAICLRRTERDQLHRHLSAALGHESFLILGRSERILEPAEIGLEQVGQRTYRRIT